MGILIDLDDGMAGLGIDGADIVRVDTEFLAGIQEGLTVITDHAAVVDFHTGLCQCAGLVHTLAAQENITGKGGFCFTGKDDVVYRVDIVDIQGSDIQNFHKHTPVNTD